MAKVLPPKAALDVVDYPIDWANLLASGESIVAATSTVETPGITDESAGSPAISGSRTTFSLSGGTEGETYRIRVEITTDQGTPARQFARTFCVTVQDLDL